MSINIGFYGSPCFDLMLYASRVLFHCGKGVLLLDLSANHSLRYAIPVTADYSGGLVEYRGVFFSTEAEEFMNLDYDVIMTYFGIREADTGGGFRIYVTNCELHMVEAVRQLYLKAREYMCEPPAIQTDGTGLFPFSPDEPNLVVLGEGAYGKGRFLCSRFEVEQEKCLLIEPGANDLLCRLSAQYDARFSFRSLSEEMKELIEKICMCALGGIIEEKRARRQFRRAFKKAERGQ